MPTYEPVIGIPAPIWGTFGDPIEAEAPTPPEGWSSNVAGVYYINRPAYLAIAEGLRNAGTGYPGNPAGTIPNPIPAGTVIFMDGEYDVDHSTYLLRALGTEENPVWILSYDPESPAIITGSWTIYHWIDEAEDPDETHYSSYLIIDGLSWDWSSTSTGGLVQIGPSSHHICIRNGASVGKGKETAEEENGDIGVPGPYNVISFLLYSGTNWDDATSDIVLSGMNISKGGNWMYSGAENDPDAMGFVFSNFTQRIWVMDCEFSYFSGCGILIGTSLPHNPDDVISRQIYIGRCVGHHLAQVAFSTKRCQDLIVSQCSVHTMRRDTPSSPNAGGFGSQYGGRNMWFIYNTIHGAQGGFSFQSGSSDIPAGSGSGSVDNVGGYIVGTTVIHVDMGTAVIPIGGGIWFDGNLVIVTANDGSGNLTIANISNGGGLLVALTDNQVFDVHTGSSDTDIWVVGNLIYDIHDKRVDGINHDPVHVGGGPTLDTELSNWRENHHSGAGTAILLRGGYDHHIIHNTIVDYDCGIISPIDGHNRYIENNIMTGRDMDVLGGDIILTGDAGGLNTIKNNIITPGDSTPRVFTAASSDICTLTAHGFVHGDRVKLSTTGSLPAELTAGTGYYVRKLDDDTFSLCTTQANANAGTVINLSGAGTGEHSIYYSGIYIRTGDDLYQTVEVLNTSKGPGNLEDAPIFVNAGARNYSLDAGSAGIDALGSTPHAVYEAFEAAWGRSITFDINGGARPYDPVLDEPGGDWDMGAFEYLSTPPIIPNAPTFSEENHITFSTYTLP